MSEAAETLIRARRRMSNEAIAKHDAAKLRGFFAADVKVIVGDGSLIQGADDLIAAFKGQFKDPDFVTYVRSPSTITLDASGERAAEEGRWAATWHGQTGLSGPYLAGWSKIDGRWMIDSELYVTVGA